MPGKRAQNSNLKEGFLFLGIILTTIFLLLLSGFNIKTYLSLRHQEKEQVLGESISLELEKEFWASFLEQNPNYLPGIYELAKIEWRLGNKNEAKILFEKIKSVNPDTEAFSVPREN